MIFFDVLTREKSKLLNSLITEQLSFSVCPGFFILSIHLIGDFEGEVAVFSAKCRDGRSIEDLPESATPSLDAHAEELYLKANPVRLTLLAAKSDYYTTASQIFGVTC